MQPRMCTYLGVQRSRCTLRKNYFALLSSLFIFLAFQASGVEFDLTGQLSGWLTGNHAQEEWQQQFGLRYLPQLTLTQPITAERFFDLEASANGWVAYDHETEKTDSDLKLYRLKLRFATPQTETRLGLQQLNFGPAQLLRSLRWFDQLDRRDPLQLTEGVYALLFKYTTLNNANVWLWGLYGNDEPKGYEIFPTKKETPEFGGRIQYPIFEGEIAAAAHFRQVETIQPLQAMDFNEQRIALDGRWEKGVGFWFETALQHQEADRLPYQWLTMTTLGADYTVGIGNGLYLVVEHLFTAASDDAFGTDEEVQISAYLLTYPIGLFDSVSAIGSYAWEERAYAQHLSWQRAYDAITIHVNLFRYPKNQSREQSSGRTAQMTGYGGQLLITYNH